MILEWWFGTCLVLELQGSEENRNNYTKNAKNSMITIFSCYFDDCNIMLCILIVVVHSYRLKGRIRHHTMRIKSMKERESEKLLACSFCNTNSFPFIQVAFHDIKSQIIQHGFLKKQLQGRVRPSTPLLCTLFDCHNIFVIFV